MGFLFKACVLSSYVISFDCNSHEHIPYLHGIVRSLLSIFHLLEELLPAYLEAVRYPPEGVSVMSDVKHLERN